MATLDDLPADQRAVLQLVLQRGRSYAQLLSLDRDVVRRRALDALDALGPDTRVPDGQRALITDYLLGQLSGEATDGARRRIADIGERAGVGSGGLVRAGAARNRPAAGDPHRAGQARARGRVRAAGGGSQQRGCGRVRAAGSGSQQRACGRVRAAGRGSQQRGCGRVRASSARRSSRTGGAILLGAVALVAIAVVAVVIVLAVNSGGSKSHSTTAAARGTTSTTSATTSGATPVAAVRLLSPTHGKKTLGFAEVVRQGGKTGVVIVAQGVPANSTHDAYAVWLYNSPSDNHILGFVNPGVKTDGKLQSAGVLPTNAGHFHELLVTLETQAKPHGPGRIVLQGALRIQ